MAAQRAVSSVATGEHVEQIPVSWLRANMSVAVRVTRVRPAQTVLADGEACWSVIQLHVVAPVQGQVQVQAPVQALVLLAAMRSVRRARAT